MALRVCDWSKYVVPRENFTYFTYQKDKLLKTRDNVSILSLEECENDRGRLCGKTATDFAFMNSLFQYDDIDTDGYHFSWYWSRRSNHLEVYTINKYGSIFGAGCWESDVGASPSITLAFDKKLSLNDIEKVFGVPVINKSQNSYFLDLGSYPQTKVDEEFKEELENAYNGGHLQNGMECTGRLYTKNGDFRGRHFSPKQNSEFIYKGERYVRTIEHGSSNLGRVYLDGTSIIQNGNDRVKWVKVEPLTFKIANYKELEKGTDELVLDCDKIIMSGIPIFPDYGHNTPKNAQVWAGSLLRAYLNSTQTKDLEMPEGFQPLKNFDFRNEGFLYQALNMTRPPVTKYKCADYYDNICDYAFDGCVGLKKILIPPQIKRIGKCAFSGCVNAQLIFGRENEELELDEQAFDGTNFKYIYVTKDNKNMILAQNIDENLEKTCKRYDFDKENFKKQVNSIFKINFFYDDAIHNLLENGGNYISLE